MKDASIIGITIAFNDPALDDEERDEQAYRLITELHELSAVESVTRVLDSELPEGSKAFGSFLVGLLQAEVSFENANRLLGFLGDRLAGKMIEIEVEANGRKLKVKASSQVELEAAIQAAKDFISTP